MSLPPDLEREVRGGISPQLRARLEAECSRQMASSPKQAGEDRIIEFVDSQGRPIRPELDRARGAYAGNKETALTFTFESTAEPWTAEEITQLRADIQLFYPMIQALIGPPAFSNTVNVIKESKGPHPGTYNLSTNTITLNSVSNRPTFCHELVHAFRDDFILNFATFEEGMAKCVEIEVLNQLPGFEGTGALRDYNQDVHYELLNQPHIGALNGAFFSGYRSPLLRYRLSAYAWGKVMIEWPTALQAFHRELYLRAAAEPKILGTESALSALAAECIPTIEGLPFLAWYKAQPILNVTPPTGDFLTLDPANNVIDAFHRGPYGNEMMHSGITIHWTKRDSRGNVLGEGTGITGPYGWVESPISNRTHRGRTTLQAEATLPSGTRLQATAMYGGLSYTSEDLGVFGVVTNADVGTVRITPLDRPQDVVIAPLVDGAFQSPSLKAVRSPCLVEFQNGSQLYAKRLTKDKGNYFVSLGPQSAVQGLTIDSFAPSKGAPGTLVTLMGNGFLSVTSVTLNETACAFSVESDVRITATVPSGAATGRIQITTRERTVTSASTFVVEPILTISGTFTGCVVGFQRTFTATRLGTPHSVTWTSQPAGLITPDGQFTAPIAPGMVMLRMVSTSDPALSSEYYFQVRGRNLMGNPWVDATDLAILAKFFGATVPDGTVSAAVCDLNGDGVVDDADVALFLLGF